MFTKKKKKPPVAAIKNPPKVLKELKNFRFVLTQVPVSQDEKGVVLLYHTELVLEERRTNAMEEPCWTYRRTLETVPSGYSEGSYMNNLFVEVVKGLLNVE